ncbi:hypothetical protein [Methylobacterium brachiatum]|uniref:hypothetical protein n=1 Tax=Methylobacterium brachiatum TaxID=269660 RepID=UPI0008E36468|nr:hypothetical protein [Methylobacterium brachiatum]SFJ38513.1 hypothetical protein SAMN02799642_04247 [Methylobacterium brachiatum]
MSLAELLKVKGLNTALVVDDAIDEVPLASDLSGLTDEWATFAIDLEEKHKQLIDEAYPVATGRRFDDKIVDDGYVAAIWRLRDQLDGLADPVFEHYVASQTTDKAYVDRLTARLAALQIDCTTRGRAFADEAMAADIIVIDLYLGAAQNKAAFDLSKRLLARAIAPRSANPPLVLLMSRNEQLPANRDEFRDQVGLIDSGFRVLRKSDIDVDDKLERQIERLAENVTDTRKLAAFFDALEKGTAQAAGRTLKIMRRLKLSDIGQVQELLLEFEGEPPGSYLVDIFDRVLQHEVEAEKGIIDAAISLNDVTSVQHPPPYLAGSPELQDVVRRTLAQNSRRLCLKTSEDFPVTFGDLLRITPPAAGPADATGRAGDAAATPAWTGLPDVQPNEVRLVLTPVCDLQRGEAPNVLLLVGEVLTLDRAAWRYGPDTRTPAVLIDDELRWISWKLKHVDTIAWKYLRDGIANGAVEIVGRLREAHALEVQQRMLSGLGRVGLVAPMPATFPVHVSIQTLAMDGTLQDLNVPELSTGAVCYVGRDEAGKTVARLVMTEGACDGIEDALRLLNPEHIAAGARPPIKHMVESGELRRTLEAGLDVSKTIEKLRSSKNGWSVIPAKAPVHEIPQLGQIAWNFDLSATAVVGNEQKKSGVLINIRDANPERALGEAAVVAEALDGASG